MKINFEKIGNVNDNIIPESKNIVKILKETSYFKNREIGEIIVLNKFNLNKDKELLERIKNTTTFNDVTELIFIDELYYFNTENQFMKIQKHKNITNIKFSGKCYLHSIWISDNGITVMGLFEKTEINGMTINADTVNINFDLGVVDIFGYISYESFVNGYKFAMNSYDILKNSDYEAFDLFYENLSKTINKTKETYYRNV